MATTRYTDSGQQNYPYLSKPHPVKPRSVNCKLDIIPYRLPYGPTDTSAHSPAQPDFKYLVPKKGLEPPHPCGYMDLNHARLPIPPLRPVVAFIVNPGGPTLLPQTSIFLRARHHVKLLALRFLDEPLRSARISFSFPAACTAANCFIGTCGVPTPTPGRTIAALASARVTERKHVHSLSTAGYRTNQAARSRSRPQQLAGNDHASLLPARPVESCGRAEKMG